MVCRTLDYGFVSQGVTVRDAFAVPAIGESSESKTLAVNACLNQPLCDLLVDGPQPSEQWPSDHFLIVADIDL